MVSIVNETPLPSQALDTPEAAKLYWDNVIATQIDHEHDKENLIVVLLNSRCVPYAWNRVSVGVLNSTLGHPREIMRPLIVGGAARFIMMHNHPSGDVSPSQADIALTTRINEISILMEIPLADHVIVGNYYYSLRESGLI